MNVNYTELKAEQIEYVEVAELSEIPNGERLFIEIDEFNLVVFNIADKIFAISDTCSHDDNPLGDGEVNDDLEVICPRHGARFDIKNGKAVSMPATVDIPAFPVRIVDGKVEIGLPLE
ncbi:MAG: non-heme iron oxygenase ferredoxin subunit [Chloroflexi bacterium]|jgi:3-phenylpropionate/trans-cinnamate dioxygenase ferredoxin subunit|nr:non-heme iron oxygenase ferredoxin subunit [Chloroflexota bacterium]MBT3668940.1 non-heme iron oxygenase ferredoxin subunit [Chloroflexota bacterium]MBT4002798.1 non-heme iron oxygenase ferredoxin subunit [Chloroflexota bacterium]MBT4305333.1 non-heme iron oxygenase ferredoxin subunit [Chloroflexota bacterium]MBT4532479.1 non-heme iron oxygenase ferredoxin subunit [Chloroflexota bacterium]